MRGGKIWWVAVVVGSFFIWQICVAINPLDVVINEVAWTGSVSSTYDEWIELYNNTASTVDLLGWTLNWQRAETSSTISLSGVIAPGAYYLLERTDDDTVLGIAADKIYTGNLSNDGEVMELKDDANQPIDFLDCSAGWWTGNNDNKFTMARVDSLVSGNTASNWRSSSQPNGTPRALNDFTATSTTDDDVDTSTPSADQLALWPYIRLNEIVSNPDEGNEWVELYNLSTSSLDLTGGWVCDSHGATSTSDCKSLAGSINPQDYLVFSWSGYYLNNDEDNVYLRNPAGEKVDEISYSDNSPATGESLARAVNGTGDWEITTTITSGTANNITAPVVSNSYSSSASSAIPSENKTTSTSVKVKTTTTAKPKIPEINLVWKLKYPTRAPVGETVFFDVSGSLDPRGGRMAYGWNLGEGVEIFGANINYAFTSSGIHQVIVHATSTAGTRDEKSFKIMVYPTGTVWGAGVELSALLPNPVSSTEEYIKISNITTGTINISNWKLLSGAQIYEIPTDTYILAGDELVYFKTISKIVLADDSDAVELRNQDDILVDSVEYIKAKDGVAYARVGENWQWQIVSSSDSLSATSVVKVPVKKTTSAKIIYYNNYAVAQARELPDDTGVIVRGVVNVLPGVMGSQYFYISDSTGGIQVYQYKKDFPELAVGDIVAVKGILSTASGARRVKLKSHQDVDILSINNAVSSTLLATDELSEESLGALVQVKGEITEIKTNYFYIDDGAGEAMVYLKTNAKIDKKKFSEGETVTVTGILEAAKTGLQIWPRRQDDIMSLGLSADLLKKQTLAGVGSSEKSVAENYLTVTAGGLTTLLIALLARARGALVWGGVKRVGALAARLIWRG